MTPIPPSKPARRIVYPESDGKPIADNTVQYEWIVTIHGGLTGTFKDDPRVFVAADLLWYPVEGDNKTSAAPDAMVAIGRPKGDRGSYKQWEEGGIPPQVVFEILSPNNGSSEMMRKFLFYEKYGVEEYYIYDPDRIKLEGYLRQGAKLTDIPEMDGWQSPRLGIRFDMSGEVLKIYRPDGEPFLTYLELLADRDANLVLAQKHEKRADEEAQRAEEERLARLQAQQRGDRAQKVAEEEKKRAEEEKKRADAAEAKAARLEEQLRRLGVASPSE